MSVTVAMQRFVNIQSALIVSSWTLQLSKSLLMR